MVVVKKCQNYLQIDFQRQTYIYTPSSRLGDDSKDFPNGKFSLCECPVDLPLLEYISAKGLESDTIVNEKLEKWGRNHLTVHVPGFFELLKQQLLSPLAIFQIFCALLWLLDEYWTYTIWTLVSVVIFEGTTVFQRTRTQKMLGGMAAAPTPIYVFRCKKWTMVTSKDLLPGDLISLSFKRRSTGPITNPTTNLTGTVVETNPNETPPTQSIAITSRDEVIPCDCLLLRGDAVVNESSLTGESVPQMKEALTNLDNSNYNKLDMNGIHRVNTLFSGTSIVTIDGNTSNKGLSDILSPPDNGAVAYVLRTGFSSSQGALMQMIEFSQQSVTGDAKETGMALFILFIFAMIAAGYVLNEGLIKKEKTTHELLLKCVIIITSVVPRQFPMQMAMAVNMALMALVKGGIFCTEPFRVPLAGKISHCFFDKTGTLTTDQLVPVGVINASNPLFKSSDGDDATIPSLCKVVDSSGITAIILAACHSLVQIDVGNDKDKEGGDSNLVGDPIELAAMKGVEWRWEANTSTAKPGIWHIQELTINFLEKKINELNSVAVLSRKPNHAASIIEIEKQIKELNEKIFLAKEKASYAMFNSVQVVSRHHFSSKLQRMSVVCKCDNNGEYEWYCLVKGSPEIIKSLLVKNDAPEWYDKTYDKLARSGLRVLALAYKKICKISQKEEPSRAFVESELHFAGFISFECKIRADSNVVIRALKESDHSVAMLTGDALLTSLHVAIQTGICSKTNNTYILHSGDNNNIDPYWIDRDIDGNEKNVLFSPNNIQQLGRNFELLTTEADFLAVAEKTGIYK